MKATLRMLIVSLIMGNLLLAGGSEKIRMEGSTTVLPIAQMTAEEFMNINPDIKISVQGGGSGVGIAALMAGTCDIANASRAMKGAEIKTAIAKGIDPVAHLVAMDGIAIIVHPSNKINNLTREAIKKIYTGKISNWKEVGGADQKIVVLSRDVASGTYEAFNKLALDEQKVRKDALLNASNKTIATAIEKTPGGIGYVGIGYLSTRVKNITVDGVKCTRENVLSRKYVYSRPLFMYTNGKPTGQVKRYLDFLLSKAGQQMVDEAGYVGLK